MQGVGRRWRFWAMSFMKHPKWAMSFMKHPKWAMSFINQPNTPYYHQSKHFIKEGAYSSVS